MPGTRTEFWDDKLAGNAKRDRANQANLLASGWRVGVVWECSLKGKAKLPIGDVITIIADWLCSSVQTLNIRGET